MLLRYKDSFAIVSHTTREAKRLSSMIINTLFIDEYQ